MPKRNHLSLQTLIAFSLLLLLLVEGITRNAPGTQLFVRGVGLALMLLAVAWPRSPGPYLILPRSILPLVGFTLYLLVLLPRTPLASHGVDILLDLGYAVLVFGVVSATLGAGWEPRGWQNGLLTLSGIIILGNVLFLLSWFGELLEITGQKLSFPPFGYRLPGAFLTHPNIEAGFLVLILPLALYRLLRAQRSLARTGWTLYLGLIVILIFLTSSRAAWISLAGALAVFALANLPGQSFRSLIRWAHHAFTRNRRLLSVVLAGVPVIVLAFYLLLVQAQTTGHQPLSTARNVVWGAGVALLRNSPLIGNGPGSTHVLILEASKLGPEDYYIHPHNLFLYLGSEGGIIAIALLSLSIGLFLRAVLANRDHRDRIGWAAMSASLVAVAIHSLADVLFEMPAYTGAVLIVGACMLNEAPERDWLHLHRRSGMLLVGGISLVLFAGTFLRLRGAMELSRHIEAFEASPSLETATLLCQLRQRYPTQPNLAFQCGLALSELAAASDDAETLRLAIQAFQAGLQIDPYWPYHWANLGALSQAVGEYAQAESAYKQAIDRAPDNALIHLNLGLLYEASGRMREAAQAYRQALYYNPWIVMSHFFESDPYRLELAKAQEDFRFNSESARRAWEGWRALQDGDRSQAELSFQSALRSNPRSGLAWAGLSRIAADREDVPQALRAAGFARLSGSRRPRVYMAYAMIQAQAGHQEAAMEGFEDLFRSLTDRQVAERYYNIVYRRPYLGFDLVPQLQLGRVSNDMLEALEAYHRMLVEAGKTRQAEQVMTYLQLYGSFSEHGQNP